LLVLNWIYDAFYSDKKIKKVPKDIDKYLTPLALAVWIMDDGMPVSVGLKIAEENILFLCNILKKNTICFAMDINLLSIYQKLPCQN
jgi:hypothetical protein